MDLILPYRLGCLGNEIWKGKLKKKTRLRCEENLSKEEFFVQQGYGPN